jgi:hypothetical protein
MKPTLLLLAGAIGFGLAAWAWLAVSNINRQATAVAGFEGMHFEPPVC